MITYEDMKQFQTRTITAICMEDTPGYPDPLIYVLDVPVEATTQEIEELFTQERIEELGEELEEEVRDNFRVCLAWSGGIPDHYEFDNRS